MAKKPEIILSRELIFKSMMQLDLLKERCGRMPKSPESSADTCSNSPNKQCQCVTSKLQTDLCRRLSEEQYLFNFINNKIYSMLADPSTLNKLKLESNAGNKIFKSCPRKTNVEEKTNKPIFHSRPVQESKVVVKQNQLSGNKVMDVFNNYISHHSCAWSNNPDRNLICVRSLGDNFVYICDVVDAKKTDQIIITPFIKENGIKVFPDNINAFDWNSHDGTLIVFGTNKGYAQVWKTDGVNSKCLKTLGQHGGPIFALKWNKKGNYIVTGSIDATSIIWDASSGQVIQRFAFHSQPILCVDWNTKRSFASCGIDRNIYVCRIGNDKPVQTFKGHEGSVHFIQWDPQGKQLVSCSVDKSLRIWSLKQSACIHILRGHNGAINSAIWSPTGPGSDNPDKELVLASASSDKTVRLWDVVSGTCMKILKKHSGSVKCLQFSSDGLYLITGGFDKKINIWKTQNYNEVCKFKSLYNICGVSWNHNRYAVGAIGDNGGVYLLDLKKFNLA